MRITKAVIDQIVANAKKKAGVDERLAAYEAAREKLFEACRVEGCGGVAAEAEYRRMEAEYRSQRERLPAEMREPGMHRLVNQDSSVRVSFAGCRDRFYWSDGLMRIAPNSWITLGADHPLTVEWKRLRDVKHDIGQLADSVDANVRGMLSNFTTVRKLLDVWPEVRELLPTEKGAAPSANLPAVQVASLNALIGLP